MPSNRDRWHKGRYGRAAQGDLVAAAHCVFPFRYYQEPILCCRNRRSPVWGLSELSLVSVSQVGPTPARRITQPNGGCDIDCAVRKRNRDRALPVGHESEQCINGSEEGRDKEAHSTYKRPHSRTV